MHGAQKLKSTKALVVLYSLILLIFAGIVWWQGISQPAKTNYPDFLRYYLFAQLINGAEGGKIYDHAAEQAVFDKFLGEPQRTSYTLITYPPTSAPFVSFLSFLPIDVAHTLWNIVGTIILFASLFLLASLRKDASKTEKIVTVTIAALGAIGSIASARGIVLGQNMFFITAVIACFWWAFKSKNSLLTGLFIAVSTFKFQYTPFLGMALLTGKRWKAIGFAVLFELLILAIATMMMGTENITKYLPWMRAAEQNPIYFETVNQVSMVCLRGLLSCFLTVETLLLSLPLFVIGLIICGIAFHHVEKRAPENLDWAIGISIVCGLLFAPHVHMYDTVMLAIAAVCTFVYKSTHWNAGIAPKIWFITLMSWPLAGWFIMGADLTFLHFHFGDLKMSVLTLWYHTVANAILLCSGLQICFSKKPVS